MTGAKATLHDVFVSKRPEIFHTHWIVEFKDGRSHSNTDAYV